MLGMTKISQV